MPIQQALQLACRAHSGQFDKGGQPYILHPLAVARALSSPEEKAVALLHDVLEDTWVTQEYLLKAGFSCSIVAAVQTLTKKEGDSYDQYLARIKKNPLARRVKMADLGHNLDMTRLQNPCVQDWQRREKYLQALAFLAFEF